MFSFLHNFAIMDSICNYRCYLRQAFAIFFIDDGFLLLKKK